MAEKPGRSKQKVGTVPGSVDECRSNRKMTLGRSLDTRAHVTAWQF